MSEATNTYELIEKYCLGLMDNKEKMLFEKDCANNPAALKAIEEYKAVLDTFNHIHNKQWVQNELDVLHTANKNSIPALTNYLKLHINKYWKTASVAASVAFIASMFSFFMARNVYKKDAAMQLNLVNKEIRDIKRNQNKISNDLNKVASKVPDAPSRFMGTSFAISNDGYFVTNKHVIEGGNKIFVFTNDNIGHQASIIATDNDNDLAILKIDEDNFSLGKNDIPYSIRGSKGTLAQKVYTLGYPKNEIVYSEGYISSINGRDGDSSKFQLELPSAPGISGAPLFDELGNIIGIVNSKESTTEATTYAIKSGILTKFITADKEISVKQLSTSSIKKETRTEQIKLVQPFVCVVKVYN